MRYIIQLNTGSFSQSTLEANEVIRTLEYCLKLLKVDKLIFGWAPDIELNRRICNYLDTYPIEKYLWLPVFAEIQDFRKTRINQNIAAAEKTAFNACDGDEFEFACQSDDTAVKRAAEVFDQLTEGCHVEGVFLDRIRYASVATSPGGIYGCWCPRCRSIYTANGVITEEIQRVAENDGLKEFLPTAQEHGIYQFPNPNIDRLMKAKRTIISRQVSELCRIFRTKGLKIGADTFAPAIADFVGQDLVTLGKQVDFIKPMVYLRTNAPAGLPFELNGMGEPFKKRLAELWGGPVDGMSLITAQMKWLKELNIMVTPGIDANTIKGICTADIDYVKTFLKELQNAGCDTTVLSWDIMRISKDTIAKLAACDDTD